MSRNPIADDRRELADLQSKTTVLPRRDSKRVLVQANVGAVVARIEPAIESRLREEIHLRTDLRVDKQGKTIIEKVVDIRVDETGRGLLEVIKLQIGCTAQSRAKIILKPGDRERAIESVERIIDVESACRARQNAQAEDLRLHVIALTPFAAEKRTSNSVQSFSERTRRNSPPCNLVSSRARLRPMPWPDAAAGLEL